MKECKFTQGYVCACAVLANWGSGDAQLILREGGFSKQNAIDAGCEQSDIDKIFPPVKPQPTEDENG